FARADLPAEEASANVAYLRQMLAEPDRWKWLARADDAVPHRRVAPTPPGAPPKQTPVAPKGTPPKQTAAAPTPAPAASKPPAGASKPAAAPKRPAPEHDGQDARVQMPLSINPLAQN